MLKFTSDKKINEMITERTSEMQHRFTEATTQHEREIMELRGEVAAGLVIRSYAAAESGRSQSDWMTVSGNPTMDIRNGYQMVLKRARDLYQNDPTGRHIPTTYINNICGPFGFTFQSKIMSDIPNADGIFVEDKMVNDIIEWAWWDWGTPLHCSVSGRQSWRAIQELLMLHWVRDGEFLCEHRLNKSKYGYQLKPLQPELIDIQYNEQLLNGNIVVQGIELDNDERVLAYWLKVPTPSARLWGMYDIGRRERVEANRLYHGFHQQHACQVRGMSLMDAIMIRMKLLSDYEKYQWIAAKANSALAMIFKNQSGKQAAPLTDTTGKKTTGNSKVEMNFSEFMVQDIQDKDMIIDRADFPNELYQHFITAMLSRIGSGVEFDLPLISSDPSQANFSSQRFGAANTQENFKRLQESLKDQLHFWVNRDWLSTALLKGALVTKSGKGLPFSKFEHFAQGAKSTGRRWDFIQPQQDAMAKIALRKMGWLSDQQYFAEKGMDMEETYNEIKAANTLRDELGIPSDFDMEIVEALNAVNEMDAAEKNNDNDAAQKASLRFIASANRWWRKKKNGHQKEELHEA